MTLPRDEKERRSDAFFERIYDSMAEKGVDDTLSLRRSLEEAGVDVESVLRQGRELFEGFLRRQSLRDARDRFERAKRAVKECQHAASELVSGARDELARALAGESSGEKYAAAYRKLEKLSDKDLESLADDAALLEFIGHLDEREEGR